MAWHKWFVRSVVFTILAGAVLGTLAYQHWTNPTAVRAQVLSKVCASFPGAVVGLDTASLHLLGYIRVNELRIARLDDPAAEVAHIPSATLYHNKEKMLDGALSFRKIDLPRPRLRIVREADGRWNVEGLAAVRQPGEPLPTIVVHQGTIQLEDRCVQPAPFKLELTQANLTLINDPIDIVTIDGSAQVELLGKVVVHGTLKRQTNELALAIKTTATPFNNALLERVACYCPTSKLQGLELQGTADLHLNLLVRPGREPAWTYEMHCQIKKTRLQHPILPLPLENLEASLRCDGVHLRVEMLRAQAGPTVLSAQGLGRFPRLDQNFEASVQLGNLEVCDTMCTRLPEKLQKLVHLFEPRGKGAVQIDVVRRDGQWTTLPGGAPSRIAILPQAASARFERFAYPLQKVTGVVHYLLPNQRVNVDLTGYAGERPVLIKGHWQGDEDKVDANIDIIASDVIVDETLVAALPEPIRKLVDSFHVTGKVDVKSHVRRKPNDQKYHTQFHVHLHDATAAWNEFRYPLTKVSGFVDVYPTHWEFRDFQGTHGDGVVLVHGRSVPPDGSHDKPGVVTEIIGKNLPLDGELRGALCTMPALLKAWDIFQPSGRLNFTASIDRRGREPSDLEVIVDVKGPSVKPAFFAYSLQDVAGHFHLRDQRLTMTRFSAMHDATRFYFDRGIVERHAGGALFVDLPELHAEQLKLSPEFLAALPVKVRHAVESLGFQDPLRVKTRLIVAHTGEAGALPDVYWDGQAWLNDATIHLGVELNRASGTLACMGRHNGRHLTGLRGNLLLERAALYNQPFRNVLCQFHVKEKQPELLLVDLKAPIFGGDVAGQASIDFHDTARYELNLTASQIDLEQFGRHNNLGSDSKLSGDTKLAGVAVARLYLSGVGSDMNTLDGHGTLDVPNGKLLNLPFLLDLIKFLGLRWPDRTMFEELHAQYAIRGRRATVSHLELFGNAVSFTGKGEINLDGTDLSLDLYPSWARIEQLLPPAVRSMPPTLSKNILTVEARGKITGQSKDMKFTKKPMPLIVDPLLNLRDRLVGAPVLESRHPTEAMLPMP